MQFNKTLLKKNKVMYNKIYNNKIIKHSKQLQHMFRQYLKTKKIKLNILQPIG